MKLKAALFDMDGVLTDTVPLHYKAWHRMFTGQGYEFDFDIYKAKVDGKPRMTGIRSVAVDVSDEQLDRMADEKQQYFLDFVENEPPEKFSDAVQLIQEMKQRGLKIAVASSSKNTVQILNKLGIYDMFDAVVTGNDIKKGKPDPEIFLTAAERMGIEPIHCVVFEDAIEGVKAGVAAGMLTIGVCRHGNRDELSHADIRVEKLDELTVDHLNEKLEAYHKA